MTTLRMTRKAAPYMGVELPAIHYTMVINHFSSTEEVRDIRLAISGDPDGFAERWFMMDQPEYDAMTGLMAAACYNDFVQRW